jgi:hypothetical protein
MQLAMMPSGGRPNNGQYHIQDLDDLRPRLLDEIEVFFKPYNGLIDKEFKPIARSGPKKARKLIQSGVEAFQKRAKGAAVLQGGVRAAG